MVTSRAKLKKTRDISITLVCSDDDLLTEILRRLPAKSILRFKSVSKHWLSLLSHRRFTLMFDKLCISPGFFFKNAYIPFDAETPSTPPFRSLSFCHDPYGIKIVQSCNGLLLCCSANELEKHTCKYYVFNPTAKQFAVIPPVIGGRNVRKNISSMALAFHHTDCPHYKLVCLYHVPDKELCRFQIYSSDTRKWRISHELFHVSQDKSFYRWVVYWNGSIYWASQFFKPICFKLDVEHFQYLVLPNHQKNIPFYFGESRGHLHWVEIADDENELCLNVYEMMSDHSGWFIKFQVELDELATAYAEMFIYYPDQSIPPLLFRKILDVVRGEKEEDTFLLVKIPNKIIRYNILDKSFKLISVLHGCIRQQQELGHRYIENIGSF